MYVAAIAAKRRSNTEEAALDRLPGLEADSIEVSGSDIEVKVKVKVVV